MAQIDYPRFAGISRAGASAGGVDYPMLAELIETDPLSRLDYRLGAGAGGRPRIPVTVGPWIETQGVRRNPKIVARELE